MLKFRRVGMRARKVGEKGPRLGKMDKSKDDARASLGENLPQQQACGARGETRGSRCT